MCSSSLNLVVSSTVTRTFSCMPSSGSSFPSRTSTLYTESFPTMKVLKWAWMSDGLCR